MESKLTLFKKWKILFFFFAMLCCNFDAGATHLRGGTISQNCLGGTDVQFTLTINWGGNFGLPSVGDAAPESMYFDFGDGNDILAAGTVTFVSVADDYYTTVATFTHTYPSATQYTAVASNCCRLSSLPNGWNDDDFDLTTIVNVGAGCNKAPSLATPTFINIPPGSSAFCFQLNASDPENNPTTFSIGTGAETGLYPDPSTVWPPGTLTSSGLLCINPTTAPGAPGGGYPDGTLIPIPIKVTDNVGGGATPGDIMLKISAVTGVPPTWDYSVTPSNGSTINFFAGIAGSINLKAEDADSGNTIDINPSGVPIGAVFTPGLPNTSSPNITAMNWTPTAADAGSYPITLIAQDNTGLQTSTSFTINVQACSAPVAICKDTIIGVDALGMLTLVPSDIDDGSTADCGLQSMTVSPNTFDCSDVGNTFTVTLTITDDNGDTDMCTAQVTIADLIPPTPVCDLSASTTLSGVTGEVDVFAFQMDDTSLDNCTAPENLVFSYSGTVMTDTLRTYTCDDIGFNDVSLWVWDEAGNVSEECFAILQVVDNTAPECMAVDITVTLDHNGADTITVADIDNGTFDHCGIESLTIDKSTFDCSDIANNPIIVTMTAVDSSGNTSTCTSNVTVQDVAHIHVHCQDATVQLDASGNGSINAVDVIVPGSLYDNCGIADTVVSPNAFTCSDIGSTVTVTLTVTDVNGNFVTCTSEITVEDITPPVATCQDITVQLDAAGNGSIMASMLDGGSTDACGIDALEYSATQTSFTCSDVGDVTVTLTVTDNNGNTAECDATVTVEDNVDPTPMCQDIDLYLDAAGIASIEGTDIDDGSNDACGIDTLYVDMPDFTCLEVGTNVVTLTVVDNNGNMSTCPSTVTVIDTIKPVAMCQNITVQLDAAGNVTIVAADVDSGSNDACGIDNLAIDNDAFDCTNIGTNDVVLTVTDVNGNMSTCTSTVTVEDNVPPMAICQDITIQLDTLGEVSIGGLDVDNGSEDACGIDTMYVDIPDFTCANVGANTVILTVVDNYGNIATCTSAVTIEDNVDPECMAQDVVVILDPFNGTASLAATTIENGSTDACGIANLEIRRSTFDFWGNPGYTSWEPSVNFDCADLDGPIEVQLRVTDVNGNESTCSAFATIVDDSSPFLNCHDNITVSIQSNGFGSVNAASLITLFGAWDNCTSLGDLNITVNGGSNVQYTCNDLGIQEIEVVVTDSQGNSTSCTVDITVLDYEDPECVPMDITVYLDASGEASIDSNAVDGGSSDNCTITSIILDNQDFTCDMVGPNTVTMTIEDQSGNTSDCTATVTVVDTIKPVCLTMDMVAQLNDAGMVSIDSNYVDNSSTDNCEVASITVSPNSFTCAEVGSNTVTQTVTDVNGNVSTCTAIVTIEDNVAPEALCMDAVVMLDASGVGTLTSVEIDNGSNDACGIDTVFIDITTFGCADVGSNDIILTVVDNNGNTSTCTASAEVVDNVVPTATCQDVTIQLDASGVATLSAADIDNGSFDECGIADICIGKGVETSSLAGELSDTDPTFTWDEDPSGPQACFFDNSIYDGCCDLNGVLHHYDQVQFTISGSDTYTFALNDINGGTDFNGIIYDSEFNPLAICDNIIYGNDDSNGGFDPLIVITLTMAPGDYILVTSTWGADILVDPAPYAWDITSLAGESISVFECAPSLEYACDEIGDNTVTLCVTDVNGNVSYCSSTVTVEDNIAPTMECQDITVILDSDGNGTIAPADVDNGSTDNCSIVEWTVGPEEVGCEPTDYSEFTLLGDYDGHRYYVSNNVMTWLEAYDDAIEHGGNLAAISDAAENSFISGAFSNRAFIGLTDQLNEDDFVWTTGESASYTNWHTGEPNDLGGEDYSEINFGNVGEWNDLYTTAELPYILEVSITGTNEVSVVLVGIDQSGNEASCLSVATLSDVTPPVALCQNITVMLDDNGVASIDSNVVDNGSSDACGIASYATTQTTFDCEDVGNVAVVLTVTDNYGNTSTCNATVTVEDNVAPEAICQDITVDLDFNGDVTITGAMIDGGSTDACGIDSLGAGAGIVDLDCSNVGPNIITLTVIDNNGNSSQCDATVIVEDNTAPLVNCVNNVEVPLNANGVGFIIKEEVVSATFDACGIVDTFIIRNDDASHPDYGIENEMLFFDCSDIGLVDVIIRVYDSNNNMEECQTAVNVKDDILPTMVCTSTSIYLDESGVAALDSDGIDDGSYDNCAIVEFSVSQTDFDCSHLGMNLITMTAEDQSGNTKSCSNGVTVLDTFAPVAMCMDITVQLDASGAATITGDMLDNGSTDACGPLTFSADITSFGCGDVGTNTVIMTVMDGSGNASTCTSTVTVEDNVAPTVECQDVTIQLNSLGEGSVTGEMLAAPSVSVTGSNESGNSGNVTSYTITASSTITLDIDWEYASNNSGAQWDPLGYVHNGTQTQLTDDAGPLMQSGTFSISLNPGDTFGPYVDATDDCCGAASGIFYGMEMTGDFDPSNWVLNTGGNGTGSTFTGSSDACGIDTYEVDISDFGCSDIGDNTVTVTVTDVNGNASTCQSTVTVEDNYAPDAVCQDITVQLDDTGNVSITGAMIDGGSTDACGIASVTASPNAFTCAEVGDNSVILTVIDNNGNVSTCEATVTVEDNVDPTALCKAYTVQLDPTGIATISAADVDDGSNDACGIASMSVSPSSFDCTNVGDNTVTLTITDNNGNVSTCDGTVTVEDNVDPTALCAALTVQLDDTGNASISADDVDGGSSDACGIASKSVSPSSFTCAEIGDQTVILTITDNNGNVSTCEATVTVEDNVSPDATCMDIDVYLDANGEAVIDSNAVDGGSFDACGIASFSTDFTEFDCSDLDNPVSVTMTVTDASGNSSQCMATVTVIDTLGPVVTCPDDIVVNTLPSDCNQNVTMPSLFPMDVCTGLATYEYTAVDINFIYTGIDTFALFPVGTTEVTVTATDGYGNTSDCTFNVTVEDNINPIIAGCDDIGDITVDGDVAQCGANVSWDETLISANDNCSGQGAGVSITSDYESGDLFPVGTTTVTYTATDDSGNTAECSFDVTVNPALPVADFTSLPTSLSVIFTNESANAIDYSWDFGDSNTSTDEDPTHVYAAAGTYNVCLTAENACGDMDTYCEDVTVNDTGECLDVVALNAGWNLISFDVDPTDNTIASVFADEISAGNLLMITSFTSIDGAIIFDPLLPPFLNSLQNIEPGYGYWVNVTNASSINVVGTCLDPNFKRDLTTGWNLISFIPQAPTPPQVYFSSLIADEVLDLVTGYDLNSKIYDPSFPIPALNTLTDLENGLGYWVKVTTDVAAADWVKGSSNSSSVRDGENLDDWGNLRTSAYDFLSGTVHGIDDGEKINVVNESGDIIVELEVIQNGYLKLTPLYGDDTGTDDLDGLIYGETLYFEYNDIQSEISIDFKGSSKVHFVDLDFESTTTGVSELTLELSATVAPNPMFNSATLSLEVPEAGDYTIHLIDMAGKKVRTIHNGMINSGPFETTIDRNDLVAGQYIIAVMGDKKDSYTRVPLLIIN